MSWYYGLKPYVPVARASPRCGQEDGLPAQERGGHPARGDRRPQDRHARSGARPGAITWSRSATSRTACPAGGATSATARSATWRSTKAKSRPRSAAPNCTPSTITIKTLPDKKWSDLKQRCTGKIGSLIELLQGRLSGQVMEVVTDRQERPVSAARRDFAEVQLPRLGHDVQARGGRALRRRCAGWTRSRSCSSSFAAWTTRN